MGTGRLEAFSDAVIAIIMTIMVLELRAPEDPHWRALSGLVPAALSYTLSFVFLGIYWNNHHHLFHAAGRVTAGVLWANLHLLFWLSLTPFATDWMGHTHFAPIPTAAYGVLMVCSAVAYYVLQSRILAAEGPESALARAIGADVKGKGSVLLYAAAVPLALVYSAAALAIYVIVALIWLVPDRRIARLEDTKALPQHGDGHEGA